ncbi:hypothetical protein, partial [Halorubrum sp. Atlit-26R]|uniref:hypothetical protein n=1 Tax=Halorubrum sp. Atlit-26R TaxID=2282128 RepID=UPI000F1081B2
FDASLTAAQTEEDVSVYGPNETITVDFTGDFFGLDRFEGFSADLVAVETDIQDEGIDQITNFEEAIEGQEAERVRTVELGLTGTTEPVEYDLSEPGRGSGDYMFFLVNEGSMPITNGTVAELDEFENTRAIGVSMATVQDDQSSVEGLDRPEYRLGETLEIEADANFPEPDADVQQVAILYEEQNDIGTGLGEQQVTVNVNNIDNISTDQLDTTTSIQAVEGPRRVEEGITILGQDLSGRDDGPGTIMTAGDVLDFVSGEVGGDINNTITGDGNVLNVSVVAKSDTGQETTFELETQENFTASNYSVIHVAQGNETGQLTTTKIDGISLQEQIDPYVTADIDEAASDTTVQPDGNFTIVADVENVGDENITETFELREGGDLITEQRIVDGEIVNEDVRQDAELNARESQRISFTVNADAADEIDGEGDYTIEFVPTQFEDNSDSITLTVSDEEPANFSVDINEDASDTEVAPNGDLTVVTNVTNTGNLTGTQAITAELNGTTVSEEVELDPDQGDSVSLTFENVDL